MPAACCLRSSGKKSRARIFASQRASLSRSCSLSSISANVYFSALVSLPISSRRAVQRSVNSSYSRARSAWKRWIIVSFTSAGEPGTFNTNPVPPCRTISSRNCSKKSACVAVSGSTQAPFTIVVAPMARRRRQSATRALDGVLGSWAKSNSQLDDELSTSTVVHHLFRIQNITAYRNVSYNQQVMGPIEAGSPHLPRNARRAGVVPGEAAFVGDGRDRELQGARGAGTAYRPDRPRAAAHRVRASRCRPVLRGPSGSRSRTARSVATQPAGRILAPIGCNTCFRKGCWLATGQQLLQIIGQQLLQTAGQRTCLRDP